MTRALPVGHRFNNPPVAPVPDDTTYIPAGPLVIGVEYRRLTDEILDAAISADLREVGGIESARPAEGIDAQGVSLHICDATDRLEYVRFDNFVGDPHYHYIVPGSHNIVIPFDDVAHGDFLDWAFQRLGERVPDMLREAGATELASRFDAGAMNAALPAVRAEVDRALQSTALESESA